MKSIILLLFLISFAPFAAHAYKHKSEAEIAQMTPAQRVDEWVKEYIYHRFDVLDDQRDLIRKYTEIDGLKALPRIIDYLNGYDPAHKNKSRNVENYESCKIMLGFIDGFAVRLRASEEGRRAIDALAHSIERMRAAGFAVKKDGYDRDNSLFVVTENDLKEAKGIGWTDDNIQNTFRFVYKIKLSDAELLDFSNYLTEHYPKYPSWSQGKLTKDDTDIAPDGLPSMNVMIEKPERYYEAYLEFKKTK